MEKNRSINLSNPTPRIGYCQDSVIEFCRELYCNIIKVDFSLKNLSGLAYNTVMNLCSDWTTELEIELDLC